VDAAAAGRWVELIAARLKIERHYLTQLDAAIGDADHGVNMDRGLAAAIGRVAELDHPSPGELLTTVGRTIVAVVGGASGPLYGSAFLAAGQTLGDAPDVSAEGLAGALRSGLEAVQRRGAATEGDKTMVDAWAPALAAFEAEVGRGGSLPTAAGAAAAAATDGMRATVPLVARKGRASYLGTRSVGHQDPGATSTALIFAALAQTFAETGGGADGRPPHGFGPPLRLG
jgi:dihydroxyacetone kinase-like protein